MNTLPSPLPTALVHVPHPPRLLLVETAGRPREALTELFAALALRGPFYAIAGGEWLPTYALVRTLRRRTPSVRQVLQRVRLSRPFTCYQVLDLLTDIRPERDPILVLDFLHHFYNPDLDFTVRRRILTQSIRQIQRLALTRNLLVFVQSLDTEEYRLFYPLVAAVADEVLQAPLPAEPEPLQPVLF